MNLDEGEQHFFRPDQIIFEQGQPSNGVFIILQGIVDLWHTNDEGKTIRIASLFDGELLGETSVINNTKRSVTAKVASPTKALFISADTFRKSLSDPFVRFTVHTLSNRLKGMYSHKNDLARSDITSQPKPPAVTITSQNPHLADYFVEPVCITSFPYTIGNLGAGFDETRDTDAGLFFPLPNASHFTNAHFEIIQRSGEIFIRDLGSAIGTFVHGARYSRYSDQAVAKLNVGNSHVAIPDQNGDPYEFTVHVPWAFSK